MRRGRSATRSAAPASSGRTPAPMPLLPVSSFSQALTWLSPVLDGNPHNEGRHPSPLTVRPPLALLACATSLHRRRSNTNCGGGSHRPISTPATKVPALQCCAVERAGLRETRRGQSSYTRVSDIMGWKLDLINQFTPPVIATQHVYYCGNRNGRGSSGCTLSATTPVHCPRDCCSLIICHL